MTIGKSEFYSKAEEALTSKGYLYFDGDHDIKGKGQQLANKPDFIAVNGCGALSRKKFGELTQKIKMEDLLWQKMKKNIA